MKQNKLFFGLATIAAAALSFAACSSDEPETSPKQQEAKTISFTSTLDGSNAGTRATSEIQGTSIAADVKIGIFATATGGDVENGTNAAYTSNGSNGLTADGSAMTCSAATTAMSFKAYAPYNADWTTVEQKTFTISADQSGNGASDGYLKSDLLYGAGSIESAPTANQQVALSFTHKLSRIKVTLENAAGASNDLAAATVTIKNTLPSIPFTPSDGTLGDATGSVTDISAGTGATTYAIVVPQTVASGTDLISVTVGGHTVIAKLSAEQTFTSGATYNYTVTLGDFGSTPSSTRTTLGAPTTTITTDWTDATESTLSPDHLWASFGTPGGNAKYNTSLHKYSWKATNNCLMNCFTFSNGELANYSTLTFTIGEITSGGTVRINFTYGSGSNDNVNYSTTYNAAGTYTIDLTQSIYGDGKSRSDIIGIRFGATNSGGSESTDGNGDYTVYAIIKASDMYLSKN